MRAALLRNSRAAWATSSLAGNTTIRFSKWWKWRGAWRCVGWLTGAINSRRVRLNAERRRQETEAELLQRLARTRPELGHWQQQCDAADPDEEPGTQVEAS